MLEKREYESLKKLFINFLCQNWKILIKRSFKILKNDKKFENKKLKFICLNDIGLCQNFRES